MFPSKINDTMPDEVLLAWHKLMKLHEKYAIPKPEKVVFSSLPEAYKPKAGGKMVLLVSDHQTLFDDK